MIKERKKKKMYHITKDEVLSWLENMRQIRKKTGEMIAFLEHMMQLQDNTKSDDYDPDDYLKSWIPTPKGKKG
jgi:dTDP-4-dehydrorhamnose reductase